MASLFAVAAPSQATTIALAKSTKERHRRMAETGETYGAVVSRLVHRAALPTVDDRWSRALDEGGFTPLEDVE